MFMMKVVFLAQCALSVSAFVTPSSNIHVRPTNNILQLSMAQDPTHAHHEQDRRSLLTNLILTGTLFLPTHSALAEEAPATPPKSKKVVVLGGAGYVGSRVTTLLAAQDGISVVSVSRSSPADQAAKIKANTGQSVPSSLEFASLDALQDDLSSVMKDASIVVSCVGIAPWEKSTARAGNGVANTRIADAAKAAGVEKFVYVGVDTQFSNGPGKFLFSEYMKGKAEAEAAVLKDFGSGSAVFIKPGLIDGAPPGEIRPPAPPGLATLSPDAVAKAVVAAVLGTVSGSVDGYDAIMAAAK
ncbi:expressed unknown protein [Seminavis robusta]|uniref:NAD(P)-binding domain-containing protein n=1 Tax=Seminavis robusta TaxID=568900 RepID=A0A9N8DX02_9STRA|nr:expressed unknown protein [Seminavis robusta]|eukprot:Sro431_g141450.1 n/a (299) ;mRNA; f:35542-36438